MFVYVLVESRGAGARCACKFSAYACGTLILGVAWRREIYQNLFKIKQNLDVRLTAYFILGSLFEREINQKLNSKLIALRAEIRSYALRHTFIGVALRARNYSKIKIQN